MSGLFSCQVNGREVRPGPARAACGAAGRAAWSSDLRGGLRGQVRQFGPWQMFGEISLCAR